MFQKTHSPLAPSGETDRMHEVDSADAPVKQAHDGATACAAYKTPPVNAATSSKR
jgi:hypothetical protein